MKISDLKKLLSKLRLSKQSKQELIDSKTTNDSDFKSMKLEDLETQLDKLYLPKMQRKAILGIIELIKIDYEMRNVLERMDGMIKAQKEEIKSTREIHKAEMQSLRWFFLVVIALLGLIVKLWIK